jgi:hypothetical protein
VSDVHLWTQSDRLGKSPPGLNLTVARW